MAKRKAPFRRPSADEQTVLGQMQVQLLVQPADIQRCNQILVEDHYLHSAQLVGEQLRYAVVWQGRWLAVATLNRKRLARRLKKNKHVDVPEGADHRALVFYHMHSIPAIYRRDSFSFGCIESAEADSIDSARLN